MNGFPWAPLVFHCNTYAHVERQTRALIELEQFLSSPKLVLKQKRNYEELEEKDTGHIDVWLYLLRPPPMPAQSGSRHFDGRNTLLLCSRLDWSSSSTSPS